MTRAGTAALAVLTAAVLAPPARQASRLPCSSRRATTPWTPRLPRTRRVRRRRWPREPRAARSCSSIRAADLVAGHAAPGRPPESRARSSMRRATARSASRGASTARASTRASPSRCATPARAPRADPGRRCGAGGVRHPALAIDRAGDALVAYNSATAKVHLNLHGAVSVAHRRPAARSRRRWPSTVRPRDRRPSPSGSTGAGSWPGRTTAASTSFRWRPTEPSARSRALPPRPASGASSPRRPATGPQPSPGRATARSRAHAVPRYYVRALTRRGRARLQRRQEVATRRIRRRHPDRRRRDRPRDPRRWTTTRPRPRWATPSRAPCARPRESGGPSVARARSPRATRAPSPRPPSPRAAGAPRWRGDCARADRLGVAGRDRACGRPGRRPDGRRQAAAARLLPQSAGRRARALDPNGTATVPTRGPVEGAHGPVMTRLMATEGSLALLARISGSNQARHQLDGLGGRSSPWSRPASARWRRPARGRLRRARVCGARPPEARPGIRVWGSVE